MSRYFSKSISYYDFLKDYGGNCKLYDPEEKGDPFHNIKDKMDIFIVGHLFGYWCKTLIFRDWWLTTGRLSDLSRTHQSHLIL